MCVNFVCLFICYYYCTLINIIIINISGAVLAFLRFWHRLSALIYLLMYQVVRTQKSTSAPGCPGGVLRLTCCGAASPLSPKATSSCCGCPDRSPDPQSFDDVDGGNLLTDLALALYRSRCNAMHHSMMSYYRIAADMSASQLQGFIYALTTGRGARRHVPIQ